MFLALQQVPYFYIHSLVYKFLYSTLYLVYYELEINLFLLCQIQKPLTIIRNAVNLVLLFTLFFIGITCVLNF